ncbi:MAG: hypothetical protein F4166_02915 [Gammaproteobacteria bacterium]|nr:hypothetical protein [Gammaproteobacteria bacterium]
MLQLFETPLNVGTGRNRDASDNIITTITDNNYETSTAETTIKHHIDAMGDGSGAARAFTHIFVKSANVATHSISVTGGNGQANPASTTIPTTVTDDSGNSVPITIDGKQNHLYKMPVSGITPATAQTLTITFTASDSNPLAIYQLLVLNEHLNIDDYRTAGLTQDEDNLIPSGRTERLPAENVFVHALGKPRDKRSKAYTARGRRNSTFIHDLETFYAKHKNFTIAAEYNRFPNLVYRATWEGELAIRWISPSKVVGRTASFRILER